MITEVKLILDRLLFLSHNLDKYFIIDSSIAFK